MLDGPGVIMQVGSLIPLPAQDAAWVTKQRKARVGYGLRVFNSNYGEFYATIVSTPGTSVLSVLVERQLRHPSLVSLPPISLLFSPPKSARRLRTLVEKATELGVHVLQPVTCARGGEVRGADQAAGQMLEWSRQAVIQSERLRGPQVRPLLSCIDACAEALAPGGSQLLVCAEPSVREKGDDQSQEQRCVPMLEALVKGNNLPNGAAILIGPEGGFKESEMREIVAAGACMVSLGSDVLRTETAAVVALGLWSGFQDCRKLDFNG